MIRERNRINSLRYRQRKKNTAPITEHEEILLIDVVSERTDAEDQDPLAESSTSIKNRLRSSSSRAKPPIDNPKSPPVHVSGSKQRVTRRHNERISKISPYFNLRVLSIREKSRQQDLQPDDITINASLQQPHVSSANLSTSISHKVATTPVAHSSRPRDSIARRLFRHFSLSSSSVLSSPSSDVSVISGSSSKSKIQVSGTSQRKARSQSARKLNYKMGKEIKILHR